MPLQMPASVKGFHDYFRLTPYASDLLAGFGYAFAAERLDLPQSGDALPWVEPLRARMEFALQNLELGAEIARREFLIAPLLFEIALYYKISLRSEFDIYVSSRLKGTLDYLVRGAGNLVIIGAKLTDMTRGFTQLAAELVALDLWSDSGAPALYGAVTVGDAWRFGVLHRKEQRVVQDVRLYTVPDDLEELLRVLIRIVTPEPRGPGAEPGTV